MIVFSISNLSKKFSTNANISCLCDKFYYNWDIIINISFIFIFIDSLIFDINILQILILISNINIFKYLFPFIFYVFPGNFDE